MKLSPFMSLSMSKLLAIMLVLGISSGCQKEFTEPMNLADDGAAVLKSAKVTNFMVITKSETTPVGFESKLAAFGEIVRSIPKIGVTVVKPTVPDFEKQVELLAEVKAAVPDLMVRWIEPEKFMEEANPPSIGDNETYFKYQWALDAIDAPEAWNAGYTGTDARVFILDSGIDADNPDLWPNLNTDLSTSFVPKEPSYNVRDSIAGYFNHGTHVAGIIAAADNKWGVIGVAPTSEIVAVKVLSEYTGSGAFSWINAGLVYAADNGADVINMSLGATFARNGFYLDDAGNLQKVPAIYYQDIILTQQRAVNYAFRKGAVIVTSAGNGGANFDGNAYIFKIPAELQNVIAVSATAPFNWYYYYYFKLSTNLDIPSSYTDYGKSLVDLAAPGGDFDSPESYSAYDMIISSGVGPYGNGYYPFYFSAGTSMASPHVAGVAALLIGKNGGKMDPSVVRKQLLKTADKIDGLGVSPWFGYGRVNAYRAVTE